MDVTMLLLMGMLIPANGFPILYSTFYKWWLNPIGRALMTKAIGLALIVDVSLAYSALGDYPYREAVRTTALLLVMLGLWYQFFVFMRIRLDRSTIRT